MAKLILRISLPFIYVLLGGCISSDVISPIPPELSRTAEVQSTDQTPTPQKRECTIEYSIVSADGVASYAWTADSEYLIYSTISDPKKLLYYSVLNGKTSNGAVDLHVVKPTPNHEDVLSRLHLMDTLYDYYFSRDQKLILFTTIPKENSTTATVDLEGETSSTKQLIQTVYISEPSKGTIQYLGKIDGMIQQVLWSDDSSKFVIDMGFRSPVSLGPVSVYIVDTIAPKLSILRPRDENKPPPLLKGVSPAGNVVVYTSLTSRNSWTLLDTITKDEMKLLFPSNTEMVWFLDNTHLLLLIHNDTDNSSVVLFNIERQSIDFEYPIDIKISRWSSNPASLSSDKKYLAIEDPASILHILTICPY